MDFKHSQGSVLVCNPRPTPISQMCYMPLAADQPIPDGGPENSTKPKKKRTKPRHKHLQKMAASNDEPDNATLHPVTSDIETKIQATMELMKNLKTADAGGLWASTSNTERAQKPKRVRNRKKSNKEKEIKEDELGDSTSGTSPDTKDGIVIKTQVKEYFKHNRKPEQSEKQTPLKEFQFQKNYRSQSPIKVEQPFFPDNRKGPNKRKSSVVKHKSDKEGFECYLTADEIQEGLKNKTMVVGPIRINSRCYKEAYISEGEEKDIMIEGLKNRNRALEGDEVVVLINPPEAWKPSGQRTGKVVAIQDEFHSRTCIGKLPPLIEPSGSYVVFSPRDPRVPRIKIPLTDPSLPVKYLSAPEQHYETLFNAQITAWTDIGFAQGVILGEVGKSGDVEVETLAILLENNLDPRPINPLLKMFYPALPYTIPEEEIAKRLDLRKECIFTIDPATARDLDDAVSAKRLENGNVEVGVHISDVAHFLQPGNLLDYTVAKRATTIYLVQRVYHMLPVELCQLCSLTALEDKLAFSVFMELSPEAEVVSNRFARTVIHSCTKLAYEHAQMVIDNPEKRFTAEDFPEVGNGFTAEDCAATIRELFKLSVIMRERRFATGALRIDQPKLCFHLDDKTQSPLSSFIYENKESHRLIEEFMLLANMTVAEHIYAAYPKLAFLRHHLSPKINMMIDLQKRLEAYGIHLDISDAGTVHSSMARYSQPLEGESELLSWSRYIVLNNLCAKPMLRANYFCPSEDSPEMHHYALNAPCYTHFTSPIRRYADVMVHRLLAASLGLAPEPTWTRQETKRIASICNRQKYSAKIAGEQSSLMFLSLYLTQPVESAAAVIDVKDRSMDVVVRDFGIMARVYTDPLPASIQFSNDDNMAQMTIQWKQGPVQFIQLFSVVRVLVARAKEGLKVTATLLPPLPEVQV